MKHCSGAINPKLLAGVSVFAVSLVFFIWLQYDGSGTSDDRELSITADETVTPTEPDERAQTATARTNTRTVPADDTPLQPTNVQNPSTSQSSRTPTSESAATPNTAQTETAQAAYEEPLGDLAISGRVLTRKGAPVAGIQVTATATHLFEEGRRKAIPRGASKRQATTAYDGAYVFEDLANGEYQISTVATERYARAYLQVRAGVNFADLVVTGHQDVRVQGIVTTSSGEPLARVKLRANVVNAREITSNKDGRYVLDIKVPDNATTLLVRASREGYQDRELQVAAGQSDDANVRELNIVMEPESGNELAEVAGTVKGPDGDPVANQRIQFSSAKQRQNYGATTKSDGTFAIRSVEPGDDYRVSINAADAYQDYFQTDIRVPEKGLTLNIQLLDRDTGVLRGQMVNVFGNAVADFSLVLQTKATSYYSQQVIGDGSGNFVVEKAPAGELRLKTKSSPYYTVDGIRLEPGAEQQVTVVLDWGYDEIQGRVVNEDGQPVAVPNISLTWVYEQNGLRTTARRTAAADEQGSFRFTQLGPGDHRLTINAAGYQPVNINHDVAMQGSDLVVELEAK